jgi:hypothetical protein
MTHYDPAARHHPVPMHIQPGNLVADRFQLSLPCLKIKLVGAVSGRDQDETDTGVRARGNNQRSPWTPHQAESELQHSQRGRRPRPKTALTSIPWPKDGRQAMPAEIRRATVPAVGSSTRRPWGCQRRRHVPPAPQRNAQTAELGAQNGQMERRTSSGAEKHGSRGCSRGGQAPERGLGLGRLWFWEAWPTQASTTHQRPS